jgi:hypothetical protein
MGMQMEIKALQYKQIDKILIFMAIYYKIE